MSSRGYFVHCGISKRLKGVLWPSVSSQVAWLGSGCGSTSKRLGFLVGTRAPIGTDSMGT